MALQTVIRDKTAAALLLLCKRFQRVGTYSNRATDPIQVYMDYKPESIELAESLGFSVEKTARELFIPRQTNFPPAAGVNVGDEITVESKAYSVELIAEAGDDSPQFKITCSRERAVNGGVK